MTEKVRSIHNGDQTLVLHKAETDAGNDRIPLREEIAVEDTWNLKRMFRSDTQWEKEFKDWKESLSAVLKYQGKLTKAPIIREFLELMDSISRRAENLSVYVFLKVTENVADSKYQEMQGRLQHTSSRFDEQTSFVRPELLSLSSASWKKLLTSEELAPWKLSLERILRFKPHTLDQKEERLLAMTGEMSRTPEQTFDFLNDSDLKFKSVRDDSGKPMPLTQGTLTLFLHSQKRNVRKTAFHEFYRSYDEHRNTLGSLFAGSVKQDVFYARARNFSGAMAASLFDEHIPTSVYEMLIDSIHRSLPIVYRYYALRKRVMKLRDIHFYDTYVPLVPNIAESWPWSDAVELVLDALKPLGHEYVRVLRKGLTTDRWVDKYENKNKSSGAFSCPCYDASPYIMLNYKSKAIDSVFTLAHEAGHSMHSWFSGKSQPYRYYHYEIFLAEIASTFNEQLLSHRLLQDATDRKYRAWLINRQIDAIRATVIRQTMFSEFEKETHEMAENGVPLTIDAIRATYRKLLNLYFGPDFTLDDDLTLECLRIPHFYRAFYVYKYATGMSAATALAQRVLSGGERERLDYFELLRGGCSAEPLELLRRAGVDMEKPDAVESTMRYFESLVNELESLLNE